jgi:integrase/recombinase XerD
MTENPQAKRRGRSIVRGRSTGVQTRSLNADYTIEQAFEMFLHAKAGEGLRQRTIADYKAHHKWFTEWLTRFQPEIVGISQVTPQTLRDYIYYLTYEKPHYEGHPTKSDAEKDKRGLAPMSVSIRISTIKTFYRWLHNEGIIQSNPAANIRKQHVEEDTIARLRTSRSTDCLTCRTKIRMLGSVTLSRRCFRVVVSNA